MSEQIDESASEYLDEQIQSNTTNLILPISYVAYIVGDKKIS